MSNRDAVSAVLSVTMGLVVACALAVSGFVLTQALDYPAARSGPDMLSPPTRGGLLILERPRNRPAPRAAGLQPPSAGGTSPTSFAQVSPGSVPTTTGAPGPTPPPPSAPGAPARRHHPSPPPAEKPPVVPEPPLALVNSLGDDRRRMSLGQFGSTGTAVFTLTSLEPQSPTCSVSDDAPVTLRVRSTDTDVAAVTPGSISFTSCTDTETVTVTPRAQGDARIAIASPPAGAPVTLDTAAASFKVAIVPELHPNLEPTVTVPAGISVQGDGTGGQTVSFTASASDVQDGSLEPTCAPASGAYFPLGATTVQCSATDSGASRIPRPSPSRSRGSRLRPPSPSRPPTPCLPTRPPWSCRPRITSGTPGRSIETRSRPTCRTTGIATRGTDRR